MTMPHLPSALGFLIFVAQLILATAFIRLIAAQTANTSAGKALAFVAP